MSHELYENWLLADKPLTDEQKSELKVHLQNCPHCQKLADGWQSSRRQILAAGMASPAPGFTNRWQQNLAVHRQLKQKAATRWLLLALVVSAVISFVILYLFLSKSTALMDWWLQTTLTFERTFIWVERLGSLLTNWLSGFPAILPPFVVLMIISSAFAILAILWVSAAKQLSAQGAM